MRYLTALMILIFFTSVSLASIAKLSSVDNGLFNNSVANAQFVPVDLSKLENIEKQLADKASKNSSGLPEISISELSKHNTENDCYLLINNNVYDVSSYINSHPGGRRAIIDNCGKEVTGLFARIHSNKAWDLLRKYKIASIAVADTLKSKALAIAFEEANPGTKVMLVEEGQDSYKLKVSKAGSVYEILLNNNGNIVSNTLLAKKGPNYFWKADASSKIFKELLEELEFEDEEYEDGEYENEGYEYEGGYGEYDDYYENYERE